jgi:hypothetical protein
MLSLIKRLFGIPDLDLNQVHMAGYVDLIDPFYHHDGELDGVEVELYSDLSLSLNLPRLRITGDEAKRFASLYGPGDYIEIVGAWSLEIPCNRVFRQNTVPLVLCLEINWTSCQHEELLLVDIPD